MPVFGKVFGKVFGIDGKIGDGIEQRRAFDSGDCHGLARKKDKDNCFSDKLADLGASSKLNAEGAFLQMLKQEGRKSADDFLRAHGANSSADLDMFLADR